MNSDFHDENKMPEQAPRRSALTNFINDIKSCFAKDELTELYPLPKEDRRLLSHSPDRGQSRRLQGDRYAADIPVTVYGYDERVKSKKDEKTQRPIAIARAEDISYSGLLLDFPMGDEPPEVGQALQLKFYMPPGILPEGYESSVDLTCKVTRHVPRANANLVGVQFDNDLSSYLQMKRWRKFEHAAFLALITTVFCVLWLKMDSIFYFLFDVPLFLYGLIASAYLLSRFIFAAFYKEVPIDPNYTPSVTIVIPCFNEEEWITKTIRNCLDQNYPEAKLEVILVDDGSSDRSLEKVYEFEERYKRDIAGRFRVVKQPQNMGKRDALAAGVLASKSNLLIFVDSDSFLDAEAVRTIVQPFRDPKVGAVTGRTEVENKWTNMLTKMQAVRYFVAFRIFKGAEGIFSTISCLSGPLACYRRDLVFKYMDQWLAQTFMGKKATFGDDRSFTNFILRYDRTEYQHNAVCYTIVPSKMRQFMKQQMRWKRSWLRESLRAGAFMWRKQPFASVSFYAGLVLPLLAPFIVLRTFVWMPFFYGTIPFTFIAGFVLMTLLMSSSYLLLKRSGLWVYGVYFCLFYLTVLVWQLIPAIFTFSVSTWGTRATTADVEVEQAKHAVS